MIDCLVSKDPHLAQLIVFADEGGGLFSGSESGPW